MLLLWEMLIFSSTWTAINSIVCDKNGYIAGTRTSTVAILTCDGEKMVVFADGKQIGEMKSDGYQKPENYTIPLGSKLLAVSCTNAAFEPQILGDISHVALTGNKWQCTGDYYQEWYSDGEQYWPTAVTDVKNGQLPYINIDGISKDAEWIGAGTIPVKGKSTTLYCRYSLLQCVVQEQACSSLHAKRINDYRFMKHVFASSQVRSVAECGENCLNAQDDCLSFNHIMATPDQGEQLCELNDATETQDPQNLIYSPGSVYYYKVDD